MVPLFVESDLAKWDRAWQLHQARRTSDRYLFYADGGAHKGFLLIDILNDPGAHDIWKPAYRQMLNAWEGIAEQFIFFGIAP